MIAEYKPRGTYLTYPIWVGPGNDRGPGYLPPWSAADECWFVRVVRDDGRRKAVAGLDPDTVIDAAEAWLWTSPEREA